MKIAVIGTGYVGLPTGVGFANKGHDVVCIDIDKNKIDELNKRNLTIYEDDLEELFLNALDNKKITFSNSFDDIKNAQLIIIAVGTPQHQTLGKANLDYVIQAAKQIANALTNYALIAIKSTVPVGTADSVKELIKSINPNLDFDIVSMPEFLREGFAVYDFYNPDRVVVGSSSDKANKIIKELYADFNLSNLVFTSTRSAELIKYASNSFLAMKVHFINEVADFCEEVGANINEVAYAIGLDSRIGSKFLNAGPGWGGSCFPKDTLALKYMADEKDCKFLLLDACIKGNENRFIKIASKIKSMLNENDTQISFLGLSFKKGTDDCRYSPAIKIIKEFKNTNFRLNCYDPKANKNAKFELKDMQNVYFYDDLYNACKNANLIVVLTEWDEFKNINYEKLSKIVASKKIYDTRNIIDLNEAFKYDFNAFCLGSKRNFDV